MLGMYKGQAGGSRESSEVMAEKMRAGTGRGQAEGSDVPGAECVWGGELGGRKVPERMEGDVTTTSRIICLPLS